MNKKNIITPVGILLRIAFIFAFIPAGIAQSRPTIVRPPNVILIMADDLGTEAVGCYGGTSYPTPNLDKLAASGVRFDHAYAYPLCTPTRVSLMTGKYNFRNWKAFGILDPREKTFGHLMQDQGYATCMVGKWQLQSYDPPEFPGSQLRRNTGMRVEDAGFDEYCMWHTAHTEDKGSRFPDPLIYQNGQFLQNTNDKYGPDVFTDYLLDFMDRHQNEPFFAYFPMALTHNPFVPTPDSEEWKDPTLRHVRDRKFFGDMVTYMDKLVGRINEKLAVLGLEEETLLIFYSDNGTHQVITSKMGEKIVRGGKGLNLDAGTRVPMIVSWKGKVKEGLVTQKMVAPSDFLPTIFEAMQRPLPLGWHTDGESFLPAFQETDPSGRDWVYIDHNPRPGWDKENFGATLFVKGKRYKLYDDNRFYDIERDPLEKHSFEPEETALKALKKRYKHILDSLRRYPAIGYLERLDPAFDALVPPHTRIEVIAEGFEWSEGPVWVPERQALLFSDVPRNVIYKWTDTDGIEVFLKPSGYTGKRPRKGGKGSNGLDLDQKGNLLLCRHGDREIAQLATSIKAAQPVFRSLATHYDGKKLNSPNDLTVDQAGNIYFTDPDYGIDKALLPEAKELSFNGVYRLSPDGTLSLLTKDLPKPNGIALSPDEKTLYVANSVPPQWVAFDLHENGGISNQRLLFDGTELVKASISKQAPDGMAVDDAGNIFATGPDGVLVLSPEGKHLGTIKTNKNTSNCDFNEDKTVLYVTCDDLILRVILGYKLGFK